MSGEGTPANQTPGRMALMGEVGFNREGLCMMNS